MLLFAIDSSSASVSPLNFFLNCIWSDTSGPQLKDRHTGSVCLYSSSCIITGIVKEGESRRTGMNVSPVMSLCGVTPNIHISAISSRDRAAITADEVRMNGALACIVRT